MACSKPLYEKKSRFYQNRKAAKGAVGAASVPFCTLLLYMHDMCVIVGGTEGLYFIGRPAEKTKEQ